MFFPPPPPQTQAMQQVQPAQASSGSHLNQTLSSTRIENTSPLNPFREFNQNFFFARRKLKRFRRKRRNSNGPNGSVMMGSQSEPLSLMGTGMGMTLGPPPPPLPPPVIRT